jgi:hypothetical protein
MIEALFIAKERNAAQEQVENIELVEGKGIVGDRNFDQSSWPGQNLTIIEREEIKNFNRVFNRTLTSAIRVET